MSDIDKLLQQQSAWQKSRKDMGWYEKVLLVERIHTGVESLQRSADRQVGESARSEHAGLDRNVNPTLQCLAAFGMPASTFDWSQYDSVPVDHQMELDLIRILELYEDDELAVNDPQRAAIHAWRLLAQRGSAACIPQLVSSLGAADSDDDWTTEELPVAIARFGAAAMPELQRYLLEEPVWADDAISMGAVAETLERIARNLPNERAQVCATLREKLHGAKNNPPRLNALIICSLLSLKDTEALPEITAAFAEDFVSSSIVDWDSVHVELGAPSTLPRRAGDERSLQDYEGDGTMDILLRAAGCEMTCSELRCFLLGSILAVDVVPPSRLLAEAMQSFDGEQIEFSTEGQAKRVMGQFMGLWNEVAAFQDRLFELPPLPARFPDVTELDFQTICCFRQRRDIAAFLDGFDLGTQTTGEPLLWREFPDELRRRLDDLKAPMQSDEPSAATQIAGAIAALRDYWSTQYLRFAASCMTVRRERMRKQKLRQQHGKIGRNDTCPCGSGKKFKHCCLPEVRR